MEDFLHTMQQEFEANRKEMEAALGREVQGEMRHNEAEKTIDVVLMCGKAQISQRVRADVLSMTQARESLVWRIFESLGKHLMIAGAEAAGAQLIGHE